MLVILNPEHEIMRDAGKAINLAVCIGMVKYKVIGRNRLLHRRFHRTEFAGTYLNNLLCPIDRHRQSRIWLAAYHVMPVVDRSFAASAKQTDRMSTENPSPCGVQSFRTSQLETKTSNE